MAGVLSFTLGLETSQFLNALGIASGRVLAFASVGNLLSVAARNISAAIERGASLTDLSRRTGESVASLYKMEEAFKVVGISSESISTLILRMQRALSGMNEQGEKTEHIFKALGLSVASLKSMGAEGQFLTIGNALAKLSRSDAAAVASSLFGRYGAGDFLQLARGMRDFRETLADSAREAALFARATGAFHELDDTIVRIKGKIGGMWAGIADGLVDSFQRVADLVKAVDWVGLGKKIGDEMRLWTQSFADSQFGELFTLTIKVGLEEATQWFGTGFLDVGKKFVDNLWTALKGIVLGLYGLLAETLSYLHIPGAQKQADQAFDRAIEAFTKAGINEGFLWNAAGGGGPSEVRKSLEALRAQLAAAAEAARNGRIGPAELPTGGATELYSPAAGRVKLTSWEKLGLVFQGPDVQIEKEYARATAENTRQLVPLMRQVAENTKNGGGTSFQRR